MESADKATRSGIPTTKEVGMESTKWQVVSRDESHSSQLESENGRDARYVHLNGKVESELARIIRCNNNKFTYVIPTEEGGTTTDEESQNILFF